MPIKNPFTYQPMRAKYTLSMLALGFGLGLGACQPGIDLAEEKKRMIEADIAFSKHALHKGTNAAFLTYADTNAVLLRANHQAIVGKNAVATYLTGQDDTHYLLTWQPDGGEIASSGDFGYTYGKYFIMPKDSLATAGEGTYLSVWKKDATGAWKWLVDTGNPGLGK